MQQVKQSSARQAMSTNTSGSMMCATVAPRTAHRTRQPALGRLITVFTALALGLLPQLALAANAGQAISVLGIPVEFILFAFTLVGVALFHNNTLLVALCGLAAVTWYKMQIAGFETGWGLDALGLHMLGEWVILTNLLALLLGFALLAHHFEDSKVPQILPRYLPDSWFGGFVLLLAIFILSGFLDNIAAALIGGSIAAIVYRHRVHLAYLAAIVAAANAGGAGSVLGDTTTTMMWISGISPLDVVHAYLPAFVALLVFGIPAAIIQQRHAPITAHAPDTTRIDWPRLWIVVIILLAAMVTNIVVNWLFKPWAEAFPYLGVAVWVAILATARYREPEWRLLPGALRGTLFLLALVTIASMMPVEQLPAASWFSSLLLGFCSAVFDNIPLTALALQQGGYDWGVLAFAVGFGGSMVWFGSSAGVALSNMFPQAKSASNWVRQAWFVPIAYLIGFAVLLLTLGWHPVAISEVEPQQEMPQQHAPAPYTPDQEALGAYDQRLAIQVAPASSQPHSEMSQ